METPIDASIKTYWRQKDAPGRGHKDTNLFDGVKRLSGEKVSDEAARLIALQLAFRNEIPARRNTNPQQGVLYLYNRVHKKLSILESEKMDEVERNSVVEELFKIASGHERLKKNASEIEVMLQDDCTLRVSYADSDWEGVGGIYFFAKDRKTPFHLPLFVIRGNPELSGSLSFNIRSIQPWASSRIPSMSMLSGGFLKGKSQESTGEFEEIGNMLRNRQRLMDRVGRIVNTGESAASSTAILPEFDAMLLTTCSYLQASGVTRINGIAQEKQDFVKADPTVLNYDTLFRKWFEKQNDEIYRWRLQGAQGTCYIPQFNTLPGTFRRVLIETYNKTQKNNKNQ